MKAQIKAIVASAVVIALCLAAVGGVTYSWFSDSEESQINIETGKIDVNATWGAVTLSSYNYSNTTVVDENNISYFPFNSGKVTVSTDDDTPGLIIKSFQLENIVPGDSFSFDITDVTLKTNVNVLFSYGYSIETVSGPDADLFIVEFNKKGTNNAFAPIENAFVEGSETVHEYDDVSVKVSVDTDAGNEYQGCEYRIQFFVKAIQSNSSLTTTVTSVDTTGPNNINLESTSAGTTASLAFNGTGLSDQNLTVSMIQGEATGYTTTDVGTDVVLGGISVTTDAEGSALAGRPATVTLEIPGQYDAADINIFHNNTLIISAGSVVSDFVSDVSGFSATYVENEGTTITFTTSLGFSKYYVTGNFPVACDGKYYKTIDTAVSAAIDGSFIKILKNIEFVQIVPTKNITIDLNGCTIRGDTTQILDPQSDKNVYAAIDVYGVTVKIIDSKGDGCIKATEYGLGANDDGVIILDSICVESEYACLSGNNRQGNMNFIATSCILTSIQSESIYMSGQNICTLEKCTLNGGISARMGQITIIDSEINGMTSPGDSFETYWNHSGSAWIGDAIYVWGGTYTSDDEDLSNTCNITIKGNSEINGNAHRAIAVYNIANKYDQTIRITVEDSVTMPEGETITIDSSKNQGRTTVTIFYNGIQLNPIPTTSTTE